MYKADTPVRYIKGLGPTRSRELNKLGIHTVLDLLEYPPLSYVYPRVTSIADASEGQVVIKAEIVSVYRSNNIASAILDDGTGKCHARWYHSPWLLSQLRPGMTVIFYGKMKGGVLSQPRWTTVESTMKNVYGGQYGVHHDTIRAALKEVLANVELPDIHGGDSGSRVRLFQMFHFPSNGDEVDAATNMLKFDEALQLQLALAERRRGREQVKGVVMEWSETQEATVLSLFPYKFTHDQSDALNDVIRDIRTATPMQRLIHGEVGSGKTAIAFYAAMLAALNGKRTLILAPTTILAQQHYDTLTGMGWNDVGLLGTTHYTTGAPVSNVIIGTHALLTKEYLLASASLVIIDEFQKFGVEQRAKLQQNNPHLLLLSATPIPRTLAATVFGDLDVSVIRELPIKRGTVITRWVHPEHRDSMYSIIEKELAKGHQAYVVYPRISGDEDEDSINAINGFGRMSRNFGNYSVGLLTGKDTSEMKMWSLKRFREGKTQILVSTIIAEVGLDNPNANIMVIEGADRFGLSQLHQLRGRVCRSTDTAFCFLVSETANQTSINRLVAIEQTNDGFVLAEEDLRLRGSGEVFSTRQHGLPDLKWVSLVDDFDLLQEAKELVASGSVGEGPKEMMRIRYDGLLQFGEVV